MSVRWISRTCSALVWLKTAWWRLTRRCWSDKSFGNWVAMMTPSPNARPSRMSGSRNGSHEPPSCPGRGVALGGAAGLADQEAVKGHKKELRDSVLHLIAGEFAEPRHGRLGQQVIESRLDVAWLNRPRSKTGESRPRRVVASSRRRTSPMASNGRYSWSADGGTA